MKPQTPLSINRRTFLKSGAAAAGGFMLSFYIPSQAKDNGVDKSTFAPNAFLRISQDNAITIILSKVEMGQGIWTTLPMLVAEELDCELKSVQVQHSPPSTAYYHTFTFMAAQLTVGSSSTLSEFDRYRYAGATARAMLIQAASERWSIPTHECGTESGFVVGANKRISYGELCADAARLTVPEVKLKEARDWKVIGKSQNRLDAASKVNGTARYGIDFQAPGLSTALLLRPPVFKSKIKKIDSTTASQIQGVQSIVETSRGVAVIAENFWAAKLGRDALIVEWEHDENMRVDSRQQFLDYQQLATKKGVVVRQNGDIAKGMNKAADLIEVEYWLPYLAHAPMETLNCSVKISGDHCEIWTGSQLPTTDQKAAARLLNIAPENIMIHTPFLGGSFGRRGSLDSDFVVEAVEIAKRSGKFIKLIWTREDDIKGGYYRPCYFHRARIGFNELNQLVAWEHRVVGQGSFRHSYVLPDPDAIDPSCTEGLSDSPYLDGIPDHSVELHITDSNVPVLPWRSVGHSQTCFVVESLIDEIAHFQKRDPFEFRKERLAHHPRYRSVLAQLEEKSGWSRPASKGIGKGVAIHNRNETIVGYVVEASFAGGKIQVHRVVCVVDCGLAVNPDGVRAQMEGSIVFGLTAALYGEITLENGEVKQKNFADYKMMRMNEMPLIEVHVVEGTDKVYGAGEPGVPAIAPALTNALFAATGKRVRRLPIKMEDLK
jgi:isoquinoline 1-oxidoreductase beta subunit